MSEGSDSAPLPTALLSSAWAHVDFDQVHSFGEMKLLLLLQGTWVLPL
jgi:hypothetical protein